MVRSSGSASRVTVRRQPQRGRYDQESIYRVLDRSRLAHISFVVERQPYCVPMLCARVDDRVLIHGSSASRMLRTLAAGAPACVTVTLLDGLVLARSALEHSANYDSVMVLGCFEPVDESDKLAAFKALTETVIPGRWDEVRPPSRNELKGVVILAMRISEASVKTRTGPPDDDDSPDALLDTWAGVIPIVTGFGPPVPSPGLRGEVSVSPSVERLVLSNGNPQSLW